MKRKIILVLLLAVLLLGGCGREQKEINSLADMKNMNLIIAQPDDADTGAFVRELCPNGSTVSQNDALLGVRSIAEGKIDAFVMGRDYLEKAIREGSVKGVKILEEPLHTYECAMGLSKLCGIPDFESAVNETMERLIADGTIEEMSQRWFEQKNEQMPEIKLEENPVYTLNAVTFGESKPYSYLKDGELTGFDVELIYRVCEQNHWGVTLSHAKYEGMLMGLATGKYDLVSANLYITDNREESISFSVPYKYEEIAVAVRDTSVPASGAADAKELEYKSLDELEGEKTFAVMTGTTGDSIVKENFPEADIQYYTTPVDGALALTNGKVDAVVFDAPPLSNISSSTGGVGLIPEYIMKENYHFVTTKSERGEKLQKEFNEWLAEQKSSGKTEEMYRFWCSNEEPRSFDFEALPDINGSLHIGVDPSGRPDVFYYSNGLAGYSVELIYNFCRDRGYSAEMSVISFDAMVPSVASGKSDIYVTFISYTEERAQSVLFTDSVVEGGVGVLVRTVGREGKASFLDTLKSGLKKTFITEDRWKLITSGLGVTALVTLGGFLLANILGAAFCACTMSKSKALQLLAEIFDRIMQGTPMVVILMILYYVIFGKSSISGIWVAIFAFGLSSGTALARQFYGAITGVDKGQTEAALAIGFTKYEAFMGIVFPQAARTALPGYFSELIGLMKGTAIIGYISVIDLTKAGDLVRSSTYDAFFPLLSVALIYFLISFGLLSLLKRIQKMLAPKRFVTQEVEK